MNNEQLVSIINNYVCDKRIRQAILIEGEWGIGKTYYIKNDLMNKLKNSSYKEIMYISLNGVKSIEQMYSDIYFTYINSLVNKEKSEAKEKVLKIGTTLTSKITEIACNKMGVDGSLYPKINDVINIKNVLIIFDDLERANASVSEIFGVINSLVEHDGNKVILVANEKEIGNTKEEDYYRRIKEKVIYRTLKYSPRLDQVIISIIKSYASENDYDYLFKNVKLFEEMCHKYKHYNLRTLVFAILAYEKIIFTLNKIKINSKYIEYEKYRLLTYTIVASIYIKKGEQLIQWEDEQEVLSIKLNGDFNNIIGYKFIDIYLLTGIYDEKKVIEILEDVLNLEESREKKIHDSVDDNNLSLFKLQEFYKLEDEELEVLLDELLMELDNYRYNIVTFKPILIILLRIKNIGIKVDVNDYVDRMIEFIYSKKKFYERVSDFDISDDDDMDLKCEYDVLVMPIRKAISKVKFDGMQNAINNCFKDENWVYKLKEISSNKLLIEYGYLSVFDKEQLHKGIKKSNTNDIIEFHNIIELIYLNNVTKRFLRPDIVNVKCLKKFLSEYNPDSKTKRNAIKKLITLLNNIIEFLS